jgi:hypothetical protein
MAQLVDCLLSECKTLSSNSGIAKKLVLFENVKIMNDKRVKPVTVVNAYNPNTWKAKAGRYEFKTILGY